MNKDYRLITLLIAIFYDFSLHLVELFNIVSLYPLYPTFPLFGVITYRVFWTLYWGLASFLVLDLVRNKK